MMAKTVLDVGCFDGWLDFLLINAGFEVDGLELMPELVAAAKRYAERNFVNYNIYEGEFLSVGIDRKYDAVTCFETLEHVGLDTAKEYIEKMESLATKGILISLPDQKAEDNPQHKWTPTKELIEELFGEKKNFSLTTNSYINKEIPMNFFISYEV
jgi:cyclopropane fatty-acyl-phospholipid synthase-like methyltransferase